MALNQDSFIWFTDSFGMLGAEYSFWDSRDDSQESSRMILSDILTTAA